MATITLTNGSSDDRFEFESDGNTSFLRAARNGQLEKVLEHLKSNIDINTSNANGLNALHLASKDGHVDIVEELLKRGAIVDAATKKGNTALHIASLAGQEEVVKLLVQHGASVNVQSQNGFTPLYMAAQENHDSVVKFLLASGANQSLSTEDGFTPLAVAMQQGHDKVVTVLLENDTRGKVRLPALHIAAKKDDVKAAKLLLENEHNPDVTSKSGFTPLHIASHYGNQSIANLLVQKGADVNYSAKHNITPLHVAAKWGKTNMLALLLEQGAQIESKTRDGLTPLHCAARSGHEQVVDMLLERGAPISSKTKNGLAPLHMAAQGDHVDAARILLYHRAPVDEVTVDYLTALHVAAHCGHVRVAKLLLDRQADANARALNGFTPLHIACKKNRIKVVELLLKHGASIGATTESGLTPLHVASFMGCMNIVIYLLQHDASPDAPTVRGETPLHLAARANQTDIIRILLRNGAQVDARAREQQTPLHIASRLGNVDIVMLLLQHGAKVDNATKDMYTSLHIAAKEGQDEVAGVLVDNGASLNATTKKGFTPLHLAAKYGHLKVAKLLVQKEAPVDAQGKNGVTPLHVASHYDHQNVALLLLDKGASPHANAKNGHTPLHIAARKNQMDIANTLLEYGALPNAESKAGFTPLHLGAQEGHTDISSLLLEHKANPSPPSKNGLTPLHLCAQEDRVPVADILVKNGAEVDAATKGGYTPLHIACHYGQANMVRFLIKNGADVRATTSLGYTPMHQAAQQGHANIVNILLENDADPNVITHSGQTPLHIAQKLGYISVIDTLKVVTTDIPNSASDEKYRVVAPEAMHETFLSDSEEEGEDTILGDQTYRYLTADEMKSLGDDSLPIDVTRDERIDSNKMVTSDDSNMFSSRNNIEDSISPEHIHPNYVEYIKKYTLDNVDIGRHPLNIGFLVSFLVDARGGAMRGCRHSGVKVVVPPRCSPCPTRITCRYVRPQRTPHPPPLMEGEALASRVLELGPVGAKFLGPVIIEVPHFAALRGKEREIVILRSDNGETWKEHTIEATEDILNEVLRESFDAEDLTQMEDSASGRITRIITQDFPQYFAVVSRVRQEVHAIGPEGGMVSSTVVPQVQAVFPQGALTKKIKVGLQAQPIDPELTAKLLGHGVAVSPVVTVEPRRRKFHKAITLSMPAPRPHSQGMINQYSGSAPTLRLLCSITGGTSRAQWEDVTGSTPLTFVNDCVSFTTTVSARFWLMDCRNIGDATKMATELYREVIHVPFMAKFVVFAKRIDPLEARLRVFCMTDDKEDKTLEHQEHFTEVAKSRDVEVLEGKEQFVEFAGNLVPITKSGDQLQFAFRAFRENRLPFSVRVKDQHAEAVSRCLFMKEPKVQKGDAPQQPICILNIVLPEEIIADCLSLTDSEISRKKQVVYADFDYYRQDPRLADMSNLLGDDWVTLANQLGLTSSEINVIKAEYPESVAKQAQSMLRMWLSQTENKAQTTNTLENSLRRIGREDIINQCLNVDESLEIIRIKNEEIQSRLKKDILNKEEKILNEKKEYAVVRRKQPEPYDKYSAEEKAFEPSSEEEEDFNKSVPERREQIQKRLSVERGKPSSQRVEIAQEITTIKRQSLVEEKLSEVPDKPIKIIQAKTVVKKSVVEDSAPEVVDTKTTKESAISDAADEKLVESQKIIAESIKTVRTDRRDSDLLEEVTHRLEHKKPVPKLISGEDTSSPKFMRTPPPSPADFLVKERATTIEEWGASKEPILKPNQEPVVEADLILKGESTATTQSLVNVGQLDNAVDDKHFLFDQTKTFIQNETFAEPYNAQSEKYVTFKPSEPIEPIEKPQVDAPKTKKPKKGIMGTIKTFVNKSLDHSDSDSEGKSPKKSKKKKTKSEPVQEKKVEPYPVKDFSESPKKETQPAKPTESKKRIFGFLDKSRKSEEKTIIVEEPPKMVESIVKINIEPPQDSFDETEDIVSQAKEVVEEIIVESQTKVQDLLEKQGICAKQESTNLIQNEIHFQGWSDDQYNICNPLKQLEEIDETPKQPELTDTPKKKQGKLFGLFGKSEKEPKREELPLDKEKKKGLFGIFESPKKTKEPEDETRDDLERRKDQIEEQIKSIEEELLKANKEKSFAEQFNLQKHTEKEEKVRKTTTKVKTKDKSKTVNVHDEIKSIQEALIPDVKVKPVPEASLILTDSKPVKSVTFKPDDEQIDKTNEEFSVSVVENKTINQTQKSFTEQTKKDGEIVEETKVEKFIVTTSTLDNKQAVDIETKPVADLHNEENRATCNDFLQSEVANYYDHKEHILPKNVEVDESDKKSKKGILQMFGIKQQSKDVDTEEKEKKKDEKKKEKRKEESPMRIFNIIKTKTEEKPLKVTEKPAKEPVISQSVPVLETPPTNGEVKETLTIIDVDELITEENRIKCDNFIQTEVKNYYDNKEPQQTPVVEEKEEKKEKKGILQMFGIKKSKDQDVADKEIAEPKQPKEIKKDKQKDTSPLRIFGKKKSEDHPEKKSEQTKVADEILQINENISDDSVKPVIETIIEDTPKTVTVIESVVKNIKKDSSEFLQNEKEQYEDSIRPTDAIENVTETISKTNVLKDPMQKAVVEVTPKKDVTPKQNIEQIPVQVPSLELTSLVDKDTRSKCNDFLKTETDRYYDYKDVSQSTVAKVESDKKSKKGHGILQIFGIKQKSKDIDASEKEIEEPKQSKDEKKKNKKKDSSPLRIFKKQKTEEQSIKSEKAIKESEELLEIETKDSTEKEIKLEQTVQKKVATEIDTNVSQIKPPSLELDTLVNKEHRIECNTFLNKEVENYYDHKEITLKDEEIDTTKHYSKPEEVTGNLEDATLKVNVSDITEQSKIDSDEFLNLEKKNYEDSIKTVSITKTQTETKIETADSLHKIVVKDITPDGTKDKKSTDAVNAKQTAMEGNAKEQEPNLQLDLLVNKENRSECNDFLQKEVTNYYDHRKGLQTESVEEVIDKKSKKGQGILQMFGIKQKSKDLDTTEKSEIESKPSRDDKKKDKRKEASPLRIFGKKKSEEKSIKVSDITEKVEKDSDKFLQTEKDNYEDSLEPSHLVSKTTETITEAEVVAEPVNGSVLKDKLTKEETIFEKKDKQTPSQNETEVATDTDLLKETLQSLQFDVLISEENRLQCNDFLQKEVKNYYDHKVNIQTKPEEEAVDKKSKKSHGILQMFGIKQKSKDVEVSEKEEESKQSKDDKKKDKKQKRKEASPMRIFGRMHSTEQSVSESSEQHKKESDEPLQTVTEHTQDSIKHPIESITKTETVTMSPHEIVPKDIVLASNQKDETSILQRDTTFASDSPKVSQFDTELHTLVSKENRSQCDDFLHKEVTNYYDHKETLPVEELVDKKTGKGLGILQMFGIKQKPKDVEALQKVVIEVKQPKDGHKIDKLKEVSPMRIFGKKKSEEKPVTTSDMTEQGTNDSNEFLKTEKENYEDPIEQLTTPEATASNEIKETCEVITQNEQTDLVPNLEFDTLVNKENRIQCNDFLQKEVINYYDHKKMLPEHKEVDTKSKGQGILRIFGIKQKSRDSDALDKQDIVDQQPTDEKIKHKKDKRKDTSPMRIFGKKKSEEQSVKSFDSIEQIKEESHGFLQTEKVNYEDSSKPVSKIISVPSEEMTSEITTKTFVKAPTTEILLDKKITIEPESKITNGTSLKPETEIDLSSLITEENRNQCNEFLGKEVQNYYDYKDSPKIEEHTEKKHKKGTGILQRFGLKQKSKDISETIDKEEVEKQEKKKDKRKDVSPMRAIFGKKVKSEDKTKEQKEEPEKTKIISPKETVEKHFKTETIDIVETISEEPIKKDYEIESSTAKADLKQEVKIATKIGETLDATKKEIDETPVKHGEMKTKEIHETDEFILKEKTNYEDAVKDKEVQELSPTFEDSLILKKEPILTEQLTEPTTISPEREFNVYSVENRVYCKNFLNNEVDKYFDKGPKPLNEPKEEKSGILSFFGKKKSKDKEADKKEITKITSSTSKDTDKKEKRGSPLKIFSKNQKSEEVLESTKPVDVKESPEKSNDFIILEKENYDHAETVIPEVKPISEKVPPKEEVTSESIVKESVTTDEKNFTDEYKLDKISTDIVTDIDTGIETIITTKQEKFVETNKNVTTITERTSGVEEKKTVIDDVRLEDLSKYIESSDIFDLKPGETYEETKITVEKTQSSKPPNKEPEQDQVHEQVPDDLCTPQARNDCHNFLSKEKENYYDHKTIIPEQVDEKEHRKSGAGILSFFGLGKSKDSEKVKEKKEAKSSKKDDKKEKQAPSKIFGVKQKSEDKIKEDVKEIISEPKIEKPEIVTVKKSDAEQPKTETKIEKHVTENEDGSIVTQTIITTEQSFPKTNEFLQKEVIHYQDSKITKPHKSSKITEPKEEKTEELKIVTVPQASEQATLIESFAETSDQMNEKSDETITCKDFIQNELENYYDHKDKPEASQEIKDAKKSSGIKSFFGIKQYSKESDHEEIEKQTDKATKQERRKSGSPLRIFGKKQKSEDLPTLKSQLSRNKSEEKSLPEGPEVHEKKRTSIIDKIVGKYKEHDEKDVDEKTKIKSPDEELEHEKKKGFLGKLSDKISGKGVKDSKIDDATHTYVSSSIKEELKSEQTPLVPTLSIDEVLTVEIPDDQTTDHHESITLMSPHEDDLNLTRTVSDYIVAAGEDEPFRKISETNIDLSNLPQDVDEYKIVKQKLIATKSFSDSSSPKVDENHEDGKPVTRIMVTTTLETRSPKDEKKKLFHISSEDDDLQDTVGASEEKIATKEDLENIISSLETQLTKDLSDATKVVTKTTTTTTTKVISEPIDITKVTSVTEVEAIEQKLRDIDQALGSLEHENILDDAVEHKLRRIERKFEHMASDAKLEAAKVETQKIKNENEFQNLLSQISVEEIADSQNEYNDIWNDLTFSKSEDVDSKTPDSQADVLDLPKGDIVYLGPVTLNKGNLVNKAGIEVDIIPIRKSPCSTPIQTRRRFPTPNLGRKRVIKSKNEARAVSSGDIFNLVVKMNPDRFLYSSNDSNNNINPSDGDFANKHKGSMCSLQEGCLVNTLSSWWDTSQSCSNIKNLCESSTQPRILVTSEDLNLNRPASNFPKSESSTSEAKEHPQLKAQAFRRRPLRYDISVDDQIEVDPREHDWLFNYSKDEKKGEASSSQTEQSKSNVPDQHQLSDEMKNLLKELEKESKQ